MSIAGARPIPAPPQRHRSPVGLALLLAALALGPLAWFLQFLALYGLASHLCFPRTTPLLGAGPSRIWMLLLAINVLGIFFALAAAGASFRNYRRARGYPSERRELSLRVEGRSRFLAGWGAMAGLGFLLAAAANTVALFVVPSCLG